MKTFQFAIATLALTLGAAGTAHAASLGVVKSLTASDSTLSSPSLSYVFNGVDANTGLLTVKASSARLFEPTALGGSSFSQSYITPPGDMLQDITLTFRIHNGLGGGYAAGSFVSGLVSIGFGNATGTARYKWDGNITAFGFQNTGASAWKQFDAIWIVSADLYQNINTATMSQLVNGYLTGGTGGLAINTTSAVSGFGSSWTIGSGGATADVWASPVPEADSAGLMLVGLATLIPFVRRRKAR